MELRHLRYFVAVARQGSFTRASELLHMAQPPLSRQVQALEEELGISLIERGPRPMRLTEAARLVFDHAVQVLERVDELKAMAQRLRDVDGRRFSIGFVASTLYGHLPTVIRRYRTTRPDVDLTLLEMTTLEQIAALKEGRIDVGFGRIPIDDPAVRRHLLRNERLVAAVPATHPSLARVGALDLGDFASDPLIIYPKAPRPSYADQVLAIYRERGLKPAALHEVRELQTALGLVAAGVGVCIVPASVESLRRDHVGYRDLSGEGVTSPIIMSHRVDDESPEIACVLGLVADIYRELGIPFGV